MSNDEISPQTKILQVPQNKEVFRIMMEDKGVVVVYENGKVEFSEGATTDDASRAFWEHLGALNPYSERVWELEEENKKLKGGLWKLLKLLSDDVRKLQESYGQKIKQFEDALETMKVTQQQLWEKEGKDDG